MLKTFSLAFQKLRAMAGGFPLAALMLALAFLMFLTASLTLNAAGPDSLSVAYVDEDGGAEAAELVDSLLTDGAGLRLIRCRDLAAAEALMKEGGAEGTLVIENGFAEKLSAGEAALSFYPADGVSTAQAASEIISSHAVVLRSRLRAAVYAEQLFGRQLSEAEREQLDRLTLETLGSAGSATETVVLGSAENTGTISVFGAFHARLGGFFAFTCLLMLLMLGSFIGSDDARAVGLRMRSLERGALHERAAGFIALLLFGLALLALFYAACGLHKPLGIAADLCYILCASALSLLLGGLGGAARAELAAPFAAFITSLAGGCFMNPDALGGAMKTVSLFTPQGQYLAALDGGVSHMAILILAAVVLCLLSAPLSRAVKRS